MGVAQQVEHRVVAPVAAGSSPVAHPIGAPVAQLDRAPDFESVGRRFESCRACHINPSIFNDLPVPYADLVSGKSTKVCGLV